MPSSSVYSHPIKLIEFIILRVPKCLLGSLRTNTDTYRHGRRIPSAWRSDSCVNVHTLFREATLCHMSHSIPLWHSILLKNKTTINFLDSLFLSFYVSQADQDKSLALILKKFVVFLLHFTFIPLFHIQTKTTNYK